MKNRNGLSASADGVVYETSARGAREMKVAIIHYWLVAQRGGEKVLEELCRLFPSAVLFTHVYDPDAVSSLLRAREIKTTFIHKLPRVKRWYKNYLPLMPLALEQLDLRSFDLVISSESGPAKGVVVPDGTPHLCYCHTPMRYLWNMYHTYRETAGPLKRLIMGPLTHYLRMWDYATAARVDHFAANSETVAGRIRKYYRREAEVIHPPVDVDAFTPVEQDKREDFYLYVGQLTAYKRPDLAVQAFNDSGRRLVVVGNGEEAPKLRKLAGRNITFTGSLSGEELHDYYGRCRALVFPGEEDFGIVPVEAQAAGTPVLAYGAGGALETVVQDITGLFFHEPTPGALNALIEDFELQRSDFSAAQIAEHARMFHPEVFRDKIQTAVNRLLPGTFSG